MCEPAIVLRPAGVQMVDEMLARLGIKTPQVFVRKGPQQQLGLIQPTGVRWGIEDPQTRMASPVCLRFVGTVRRAVIQDQVQAAGPGIATGELAKRPQEMLMVIGLQATPPIEPSYTFNAARNVTVPSRLYSNSRRAICPRRIGWGGQRRTSTCLWGVSSRQSTTSSRS
jgi:hypothetical protein